MKTILDSYREQVDNTPSIVLENTHHLYLQVVAYAQKYWGTDDIYAEAHHCENCDLPSDNYNDFNGHDFCDRCYSDFTTPNREELEEQHGQVWNTKELQQDFTVQGFASPCVVVIRKSDGVKGTLEFIHQPRFYFDFVEAG